MRLIVAGGREHRLSDRDRARLAALCAEREVALVITGGARGVDTDAHDWALGQGLATAVFAANWDFHDRAAGPIRNADMAKVGDAVVLFPGGRGTQSMHLEATKAGIEIIDWREP